MNNKIYIICTLGPSSLNKNFLKFATKNIDLLRLNMSHLSEKNLLKNIKLIRKFTRVPICLDTEGAQIRTKVKKEKFLKKNIKLKIFMSNSKGNFSVYPDSVFNKLKRNDLLKIGFDNLKVKLIKIKKNYIVSKVISSGILEKNKGVHVENRRLKLNYVTKKDEKAIKIALKNKINYFALSFTNTVNDVQKFEKLLKKKNRIYKIETSQAVKNFSKILKTANNFLIDRGDLSKDIEIENIPKVQRELFRLKKRYKNKKFFVATNLLESMIKNNFPTRGEANDIFSSLEMGSDGLVLAAETAIGKYPFDSVKFLKKMISNFQGK